MTATTVSRWRWSTGLGDTVGGLRRSPFVRNIGQTFAARVVALAMGFVTSVVVARALGPSGRGALAVAAATSGLGVSLFTVGLHTANSYYAARDRSLLPGLLGNSLAVGLALGTVGGALTVGLAAWATDDSSLSLILTLVVAASVPVGLVFTYLQHLLLGVGDVRTFNINEVSNRAAALIFVVAVLAYVGGLSALSVFATMTGATALCCVVSYRRLLHATGQRPRTELSLLRTNLGYGFRAYLASLFAFLILRVDVFIIRATLGPAKTGLYAVAASAADLLYLLPAAAGALLFPKLAAIVGRQEQWHSARRTATGVGAVVAGAAVVLALLAKPAVTLLYGADFAGASTPLVFLALAMVPYSVNSMLVAYLAAIGSPWSTAAVWAGGAALNIVANLIFVPRYGLSAAAAVSVSTYGGVALANYWLVRRSLRCG